MQSADAEAFVNVGMISWLKQRQEWTAKRHSGSKRTARPINSDLLYEELYSGLIIVNFRSNHNSENAKQGALSQVVPLPDLVSVLNEIWEADGPD
jgi:hypothetical protein